MKLPIIVYIDYQTDMPRVGCASTQDILRSTRVGFKHLGGWTSKSHVHQMPFPYSYWLLQCSYALNTALLFLAVTIHSLKLPCFAVGQCGPSLLRLGRFEIVSGRRVDDLRPD